MNQIATIDQPARFSREWAMPSGDTFSIPPVARLLRWHLRDCTEVVDPFARNSTLAKYRNDLNPETTAEWHLDAEEFCRQMQRRGVVADAVLFDPPYSQRQISELYQSVGRTPTMTDTQNSRLYKNVRAGLDRLLAVGGLAISCGWNSCGFGRAYELVELLLVAHGGAHNDTIVTIERKVAGALRLESAA